MPFSLEKHEALGLHRLREILDYDPVSGHLTWKYRKPITNGDKSFNARYAGKRAGSKNKRRAIHLCISLDGKLRVFLAHILAWAIYYGAWPTFEIDHENGDDCDNSIDNLRPSKHFENMRNQHKVFGRIAFKGVTLDSKSGHPVASIRIRGKLKHLGTFANFEDAARAYDVAASEFFGEFARTNAQLGLLPSAG